MKKQVVLNHTGRRRGKKFVSKFSNGSRKVTRTKKDKGG